MRVGIERDEDDLVVSGHTRADLSIGRVRREAGGVAHRGAVDAVELPELAFGSPEAAHAEQGLFEIRPETARRCVGH